MAENFYYLVLGILAVWRITHLLAAEDGPWDMVVKVRRAAGSGFWGKLLDCFQCLSLWVDLPFAVVSGGAVADRFLLWLGFSAGAILLQKATTPTWPAPPVHMIEEPAQSNEPKS